MAKGGAKLSSNQTNEVRERLVTGAKSQVLFAVSHVLAAVDAIVVAARLALYAAATREARIVTVTASDEIGEPKDTKGMN